MATTTIHVRSLGIAVLMGLASTSAVASADDARASTKASLDEAQRRFQRGKELYDESDFQAALVEFRRAYELAPNYRLLYNIAQVQYQLQDYPATLRTFNRYLTEGQGDVSPQRREEVQKEIERLKSRIASVSVTVNMAQAEILVDDVSVGKAPLSEPVLVSIGRRKISASLSGYVPVSKVVEVAGMDSIKVNLELSETADARGGEAGRENGSGSAPEAPQKGRGIPWAAWAITGGLGLATGITGGLALAASGDLTKKLDTFGTSPADFEAAGSKTKALALTTDILLGATVVGAGVSLILTLTRGPEKPDRKAASLPPIRVGVGLGSIGITGAF